MRLLLACAGRLKLGPERELVARYIERAAAAGPAIGFARIELREVAESRAPRAADRKKEEARALRRLLPADAALVAFDECGQQITSRGLAAALARMRDAGLGCAVLVIGGPGGLDRSFVAAASLALSLGPMTWPHQLARAMAAEQIYRTITILAGHPYHRD